MTKIVDLSTRRNNTPETPSDALQDANYDKVDELQYSWGKVFMDMLDEAEIGDNSEEFWRIYALFGETFRALLCYDQNLQHPFHDLAEKMIDVEFENDDAIIYYKDVHLYVSEFPLIDEDGNTSI